MIRSLVKKVPVPRWHKQANRASIRVVRTVPHSLRKVVEKQENALAWSAEPPECRCNSQYRHLWESAGDITILDGHFALLPVTIYQHDSVLRSGDPLPQHGQKSRCETVAGLQRLAGSLHAEHPPWRSALPLNLFNESGSDLKRVCQVVENLCSVAYVRIVDKHSSAMWAFCRRWAWYEHIRFVKDEGYQPVDKSVLQVSRILKERVSEHGWKAGTNARIALMYLLGKAKSLRLPDILWRPIAAASRPFVSRNTLRIAARAFTCFLRCLCTEVTAAILALRISDIAPWLNDLSHWGATCIGEAGCKEQFNRIKPSTTLEEIREASQFLYQKRRWGSTDIVWSIHRDCKALDRAGKAASASFWHLSHEELESMVRFSLTEHNTVWCAGSLWKRSGAIPMGGSFSAQCADLHSIWAMKRNVDIMKRFGKLVRTVPFPLWETPTGNTVSLSQLRDNVNVAAKGPTAPQEMSRVCSALNDCWGLPVLCDCLSQGEECTGVCMSQRLRILGLTVHVGETVVCYSTPSALNNQLILKWGPSLHSPWAMNAASLSNIFTGSLINSMPFQFSWSCFLLSVSSWMQLAFLCGHSASVILRAMKAAVHKCCSRSEWCVEASIGWAVVQARNLPTSPKDAGGLLQRWLQQQAHWSDVKYACWHVPHEGSCSEHCAAWNSDYHMLSHI